ncbi:MAG: aldose 1-epimerase family protein [Eubacteriales bacterium]|nr:aldose 1-epimerase family protein [Eubacteriales bacterium]
MFYTIKNDSLKVEINSLGAELHSIQTADGTEYLWQGDPAVWKGQAPNLFPYVARLTEGKYTYRGKEYSMKIHGFINVVELAVEKSAEDSITFRYESNEETLKQYPFAFVYHITYALEDHKLNVITEIDNPGEERSYFGMGGHPGFRVPLEEGLGFEDYFIEFSHPSNPWRVGFTEDCHLNGKDESYPLDQDTRLWLHHDLFDHDAIVLRHIDHALTLRSEKGRRAVKVSYPDFPVIGFWHMPHKEAPYVCIEPWRSLPSRSNVVEDFEQQADLVALNPKETYRNAWTIEIVE